MKFLIVDDESIVRRALNRALIGAGHEVVEAADGRKGVEEWRRFQPDLVFLDVLMPELSGLQVLHEMSTFNKAKVILMSAYSGVYDPNDVKKLGADLFITKPFEDIFALIKVAENLVNA